LFAGLPYGDPTRSELFGGLSISLRVAGFVVVTAGGGTGSAGRMLATINPAWALTVPSTASLVPFSLSLAIKSDQTGHLNHSQPIISRSD
jgi:hypothetical protein